MSALLRSRRTVTFWPDAVSRPHWALRTPCERSPLCNTLNTAIVLRSRADELAVAFIIGGAFAKVVESFTKIIIELLAKAGGAPNFDAWQPGGLTSVGPFLTVLVAFVIMAFIKTRLRRVEQTDAAQADDLRRRAAQLRTQIMALRPDLAPAIDPVSAGS